MKIKINKGGKYSEAPGFYFFLALFLNNKILVDIVRIFANNYAPGLVSIVEIVRNLLYVVCLLYFVIVTIMFGIRKDLFVVLLTILIVIIGSLFIEPELLSFWSDGLLIFLSRVLVGFWFFRYAEDFEKILKYQSYFLIPTLVYAILISTIGQSDDYMGESYNLLPATLMFLYYGTRYKKYLYSVAAVFILCIIALYGARGALLCALLSIALYYIIGTDRKFSLKRILFLLALCIAAAIIAVNITTILEFILEKVGASRTISIILNGNLTTDSGRSEFQDVMWAEVLNNVRHLLPCGIFSDRLYLSSIRMVAIDETLYPHNIFLEIFYQFGLILGAVFIAYMFYVFISGLIYTLKRKQSAESILFFSFVVIAVVQLMISSSYLLSSFWGIAMGLCMNIMKKSKKGKLTKRAYVKLSKMSLFKGCNNEQANR